MSETFLSIFGNTKNNEKETQYALLDYDQNDELVKHRPSAVDEYFHRQNVDDNWKKKNFKKIKWADFDFLLLYVACVLLINIRKKL